MPARKSLLLALPRSLLAHVFPGSCKKPLSYSGLLLCWGVGDQALLVGWQGPVYRVLLFVHTSPTAYKALQGCPCWLLHWDLLALTLFVAMPVHVQGVAPLRYIFLAYDRFSQA